MAREPEEETGEPNDSDVVLELAHAREGFTIGDLTDDLIEEGLFGAIPAGLSLKLRKHLRNGLMDWVKGVVKRERRLDGHHAFRALSEEPGKALWKLWSAMSRTEARRAFALLARKHKEMGKEVRELRNMHIDRFKEDPMDFVE